MLRTDWPVAHTRGSDPGRKMTFENALLQTVGYGHVWDAAVVAEHAPMGSKPIATFHILGCPSEQQVAEAEARDKHIGLADLAGLQLQPLERVAGVIDFHTLAGLKLARRDGSLSVLRELAIEL